MLTSPVPIPLFIVAIVLELGFFVLAVIAAAAIVQLVKIVERVLAEQAHTLHALREVLAEIRAVTRRP